MADLPGPWSVWWPVAPLGRLGRPGWARVVSGSARLGAQSFALLLGLRLPLAGRLSGSCRFPLSLSEGVFKTFTVSEVDSEVFSPFRKSSYWLEMILVSSYLGILR